MWSELIAKSLPSDVAMGALMFHREVSLPYNDAVDGERDSLFAMATKYFRVEAMPFPGLDRPTRISINDNPVVLIPDVLTKRCFDKHMEIQQTWYFLCGLYDAALRKLVMNAPDGYKEGYEQFIREMSKYAAELALYGDRGFFAKWVKEQGLHRIHDHLGHPYSIFGFYLAKSVPGVTAIAYHLSGGMVCSDDATHPCDIPCGDTFQSKGRVIHSVGNAADIKLAERIILDRGLSFSEHTEMWHKNMEVEDGSANSVHVELISYLMGEPVSAHLKNYYIGRRTVAILIRDPEKVLIKDAVA